jgi:predicted transcriptional regulator
MVQRGKTTLEKPLTEVELELMNAIWDLSDVPGNTGPGCTVKDVQQALPKERDLAYTSVATIMKILEQKGAIKSTKQDRAHTYEPLVSRAEYESMSLRHLTKNLFQGDPSSMVMRLLSDDLLSKEELNAIRRILNAGLGSEGKRS